MRSGRRRLLRWLAASLLALSLLASAGLGVALRRGAVAPFTATLRLDSQRSVVVHYGSTCLKVFKRQLTCTIDSTGYPGYALQLRYHAPQHSRELIGLTWPAE
jgi:hypothetical protein